MKEVTLARQIELLEHLFHTDAWTELLLPQMSAASDAIYAQIKQTTDPNKLLHLSGQALGLDAILLLPRAKEVMEENLKNLSEASPTGAADKA